MRRILFLACMGAIVGPVLDYLHTATGTIAYAHPVLFGLAWWVPLLYLSAALGIGLSHPNADQMLRRVSTRGLSSPELIVGMAVMAAIWAGSGLLKGNPLLASAVLGPASLALWWFLDRTWQGLATAAVTACMGVMIEYTLTTLGQFHYLSSDVGPLPSWLPWLYVGGSVAMGNVGRRLLQPSATVAT